jgi:hypothetical protein
MHRTNIYIPDPTMVLLRKQANAEGITVSELVRRILAAYYANATKASPK